MSPELFAIVHATGVRMSQYYDLLRAVSEESGTPYIQNKRKALLELLHRGVSYSVAVREAAKSAGGKIRKHRGEAPCVYLLTCVVSGKAYVGQSTRGIRYRDCIHRALRSRVRKCLAEGITDFAGFSQKYKCNSGSPLLIAEIFAYPEDSMWAIELLHETLHGETIPEIRKVLTPLEISEINSRGTLFPGGLNSALGFQPCKEVRARLSAAHKGKPKPQEQRDRMSAAHRERHAKKRSQGIANISGCD